jgi:hypothetical protein
MTAVEQSIRGTIPTDAGMHGIWSPAAFANVDAYDSWARELEEDADIRRHILAGDFVPINIGTDLVAEIEVRVNTPGSALLSDRERAFLALSSQAYRFQSSGAVAVGGIEHVAARVDAPAKGMPLPPGEWSVVVHMLDWDKEPGAFIAPGQPSPSALPDFLVTITPASPNQQFHGSLETFDRERGAR